MTLPLPTAYIEDPTLRVAFETIQLAWPDTVRIVRGLITAAGGITAGTGFTISKGGAGLYGINFTKAFLVAPTVTITGVGNNADAIFAVTAVSTIAATVQCYVVSAGALTNQGFHFQVVQI